MLGRYGHGDTGDMEPMTTGDEVPDKRVRVVRAGAKRPGVTVIATCDDAMQAAKVMGAILARAAREAQERREGMN